MGLVGQVRPEMDAGTFTVPGRLCDGRAEVRLGRHAGERALDGGEAEGIVWRPWRLSRRGRQRRSVRVDAVAGVRGLGGVARRFGGRGRVAVRKLDPGAGLGFGGPVPVVDVGDGDFHPPQEHPQGGDQRAEPEQAPKAAPHGEAGRVGEMGTGADAAGAS